MRRFSGICSVVASSTNDDWLSALLTDSQTGRENLVDPWLRASLSFCRARKRGFDDAANRVEIFDPGWIQPEELAAFDPARPLTDFFFGDILSQRIVKATRFLIGVEPRRLTLAR